MLEIGSLVDGKYRILSQCGQGGMSVVYMARNERANKTWAIKEVRKDGVHNFEVVKQGLLVETDLLKKLSHPHLPSIVDVIDGDECFLIVMDFIEGRTLRDILQEQGAQPQKEVVEWAKQLCRVLGYLHSRTPPIIYRDMKPGNVMLRPDGNVVLFDFGTAREYKEAGLEDTTCLGTRGYAAPEQYGGQGQSDVRTDIFCMGATMYHLLTGHTPGEFFREIQPIRHWNVNLSRGLEAVIQKCMQREPDRRYQSSAELYYALDHYWESEAEYRKKQIGKLKGFLIPAVLALVLSVGSLLFGGLKRQVTSSNYEACLMAAGNSADKEEELENYRRAVRLDPFRSEGYLGFLLEGLLDDQVLTEEESENLRKLLIEYGDKEQTYEQIFRENEAGYARFAYECGIAYYYRYEDRENKKHAKGYFRVAGASGHLEPKQMERAQLLYVISDYYARIGKMDETGDTVISFRDYWDDLVRLSEGNLVEKDNEKTALILYGEMISQVISGAVDFKKAGVTQEELEIQIANIKLHMETDFTCVSSGNKALVEQETERLWKEIQKAEQMIHSAFSGKGEAET